VSSTAVPEQPAVDKASDAKTQTNQGKSLGGRMSWSTAGYET
jgi:hypothetical protein